MSTAINSNHTGRPLGDVAQFLRGITFKPEDVVEPGTDNSVVCMRTKNVQTDLDQSDLIAVPNQFVKRDELYLRESDILVSTANSWNLVGKCSWVPRLDYDATAGGFISILRADTKKILPRYLYYWFSSDAVQHAVRLCGRQTTNISNMSFERCEELRIPLPPLSEQKRIADILDKAYAIRRKRRESQSMVTALLDSEFWQLFGEEMAIPSHLTDHVLFDAVDFLDYRGKSPPKSNSGIPLVTAKHVKRGFFEFDPPEFIPEDRYKEWMQRGLPRPGDVLFTTEGHTMGSAAMLPPYEKVALAQRLIALQCKDNIRPAFLLHFVLTDRFQSEVRKRATGSAAQGIRASELQTIPLPLPGIEKQDAFSRIAASVARLSQRLANSTVDASELFDSLVQRAFRGQL